MKRKRLMTLLSLNLLTTFFMAGGLYTYHQTSYKNAATKQYNFLSKLVERELYKIQKDHQRLVANYASLSSSQKTQLSPLLPFRHFLKFENDQLSPLHKQQDLPPLPKSSFSEPAQIYFFKDKGQLHVLMTMLSPADKKTIYTTSQPLAEPIEGLRDITKVEYTVAEQVNDNRIRSFYSTLQKKNRKKLLQEVNLQLAESTLNLSGQVYQHYVTELSETPPLKQWIVLSFAVNQYEFVTTFTALLLLILAFVIVNSVLIFIW